MKKVKRITNILYMAGIALLILVAILLIAGKAGIGGVRALVVESGSMEPVIKTKSIVVTAPSSAYKTQDIITFKQSGRAEVLVTHRVIEKSTLGGQTIFITKGDANEEADNEPVPQRDVIGKVTLTIPFIGEIISFTRTTPGFIFIIVIPAVLIIYSELLNIKNAISDYRQKRRQNNLVHPLK